MNSNMLIFGWNRPLPGREKISHEHFTQFVEYLGGLQSKGTITDFDIVFLDPHGGDLNGFFLLKGPTAKLDALLASEDWAKHMLRASMHLDGSGVIRGYTGEAIMPRMEMWISSIPG